MEAKLFKQNRWQEAFQAWWYGYHRVAINVRLLSSMGVAVMDGDSPIAIAHIYPCPTADMAWIGFTARDPFISPAKATAALKLLIETAEDEIYRLGYSIVYTAYDAPTLQAICAERGYFAGSVVKEYFKEISR